MMKKHHTFMENPKPDSKKGLTKEGVEKIIKEYKEIRPLKRLKEKRQKMKNKKGIFSK